MPRAGLAFLAALAGAHAAAAQGTELTGPYPLSNASHTLTILPDTDVPGSGAKDVRFQFQPGFDVSGPVLAAPPPAPWLSQGFRTWSVYVIDASGRVPGPGQNPTEPTLEAIRPADASQTVHLEEVDADTVILHWTGCQLAGAPAESVDVHLEIDMPVDQVDATWRLSVDSQLAERVIHSASLSFSIQENPVQLDELLMASGHLVRDAAQHLEANDEPLVDTSALPSGSKYLDLEWHGEAWGLLQVNAFLRGGAALYLALSDEIGRELTSFRYGADPTAIYTRLEAVLPAHELVSPPATVQWNPMRVAALPGNWWDVAEHYRGWIETEASGPGEIGGLGLLELRGDVADAVKYGGQVVVLPVTDPLGPLADYGADVWGPDPLVPGMGRNLAEKVAAYSQHYGDLDVVVFQFGTAYCGDSSGIGPYEVLPQWEDNCGFLEAAGIPFFLYMLDNEWSMDSPTFLSGGWGSEQVTLLDGQKFVVPGPDELGLPPASYSQAKIDPFSAQWMQHLRQRAAAFANLGVDGIYVDNYFAFAPETCFDVLHGHSGGYGPHVVGSYSDGLDGIHLGGLDAGAVICTYTEVSNESNVAARGCILGPSQVGQDWATGDEHTTLVPLWAAAYAHLAPQGPVRLPPFELVDPKLPGGASWERGSQGSTQGGFQQEGQLPGGVLSPSTEVPAEGQAAPAWSVVDLAPQHRRTACYTLAFGAVNHCGSWVPDVGLHLQPTAPLAHEIALAELAGYQAVVDYAARLARVRGVAGLAPFLATGRIERELTFDPPIATDTVTLISIAGQLGEIDREEAPIVLHSVSRSLLDPAVPELGVFLANHSDRRWLGGTAALSPTSYELPAGAYEFAELDVESGDQVGADLASFASSGDPTEVFPLQFPPIGAEDMRFFVVRPLQ